MYSPGGTGAPCHSGVGVGVGAGVVVAEGCGVGLADKVGAGVAAGMAVGRGVGSMTKVIGTKPGVGETVGSPWFREGTASGRGVATPKED